MANWTTPETHGAVGDGATDDTVALQAAVDSGDHVELTDAKTYKVTNTVTIDKSIIVRGPRSATVLWGGSADDRDILRVTEDDVTLEGFLIDGQRTSDTIASGFSSGHAGVTFFESGVNHKGATCRDLEVVNCGEYGIQTRRFADVLVERCEIDRIGYAGVAVWSAERALVQNCKVSRIFPGNGGVAPYLNAYGVVFSNFGGEATCDHVQALYNRISDVHTWEGIDEHSSNFVEIIGNTIINTSQAIALEHGSQTRALRNAVVAHNNVLGWGISRTKDSTAFKHRGGIIVNGGWSGPVYGDTVSVSNNALYYHGDSTASGDPGATDLASIYVLRGRAITVVGNSVYIPYKRGIYLSTDCFAYTCSANVVDAVQASNSIQKGIETASTAYGAVVGNTVIGSGTDIQVNNSSDINANNRTA